MPNPKFNIASGTIERTYPSILDEDEKYEQLIMDYLDELAEPPF